MLLDLNNAFLNYIKDPGNLPLIIVLGVVILVILVLVIVMIVGTVRSKKRSRRETEEAVLALSQVPPDEEYTPYSPEEEPSPAETEEPTEPVVAAEEAPAEEVPTEAQPTEPAAPEEKQEETAYAAVETEEPEMEQKKTEPSKKEEPAKKEAKKPIAKAEPKKEPAKKPEPKKAEPAKVSAANGKWVIEAVKGKYWLSLIAPNGQVMLESPTPYASLQSARSGVKTYQDNIAAERLEITEHKNGDSQVQVLNGRGGLLATSSTYSSRAQAESARDSIKRWASTTAIEELAEKKD